MVLVHTASFIFPSKQGNRHSWKPGDQLPSSLVTQTPLILTNSQMSHVGNQDIYFPIFDLYPRSLLSNSFFYISAMCPETLSSLPLGPCSKWCPIPISMTKTKPCISCYVYYFRKLSLDTCIKCLVVAPKSAFCFPSYHLY